MPNHDGYGLSNEAAHITVKGSLTCSRDRPILCCSAQEFDLSYAQNYAHVSHCVSNIEQHQWRMQYQLNFTFVNVNTKLELSLAMTTCYLYHFWSATYNSYYAGIMPNTFIYLLHVCSKLCWHNRLVPSMQLHIYSYTLAVVTSWWIAPENLVVTTAGWEWNSQKEISDFW